MHKPVTREHGKGVTPRLGSTPVVAATQLRSPGMRVAAPTRTTLEARRGRGAYLPAAAAVAPAPSTPGLHTGHSRQRRKWLQSAGCGGSGAMHSLHERARKLLGWKETRWGAVLQVAASRT